MYQFKSISVEYKPDDGWNILHKFYQTIGQLIFGTPLVTQFVRYAVKPICARWPLSRAKFARAICHRGRNIVASL